MSNRVNVVVGGQTDPSLGQTFDALLGRLTGMNGFLEGMRTQIAALAGAAGLGRLVHIGISFNSQLQVAQRSLAGVFLSVDKSVGSVDGAFTKAGKAVSELQRQARSASADFSDLLSAYSANASLLFGAGVRDLRQQIELVTVLGDVVKSKGLPGNQAITEMRALFTGNFGPDALVANQLIAPGERSAWRQALASGGAYDFLRPRLQPFAEVASRASRDMDVASGNLRESAANLLAIISRPAFAQLGPAMDKLASTLNDPTWQQWITRTVGVLQSLFASAALLVGARAVGGLARGGLAHLFGVASAGDALASVREFGGLNALRLGASSAAKSIASLTLRFGALGAAIYGLTAIIKKLTLDRQTAEDNAVAKVRLETQIRNAVAQGQLDQSTASAMELMLEEGFKPRPKMRYQPGSWAPNAVIEAPDLQAASQAVQDVTELLATTVGRSVAAAVQSAAPRWSGRLPWDTSAGGDGGAFSVRGWLTRGSMQLWTQQINYARSMARDLGVIAQAVQRYLPKLQEQI